MNSAAEILVIDDDLHVREMVAAALEMVGFHVVTAEDGEAGLNLALKLLPDLVLCDIDMPKKDGFKVLAMFRENKKTVLIPFIFLTGITDRDFMRRGMDLGANDYLTKPFTADEIISAVVSKLRQREGLEETLKKKLDDLRLSITTSVPHELNTPLTGILGFGELLLTQGATLKPEELQDMARQIIKSGKRLHQTLDKFWSYAQVLMLASDRDACELLRSERLGDAGRLLGATARSVAASHSRLEDLQTELEDVHLNISARHFTQIAELILDNAFRYSAPGERVELTLTAARQGSQAELSVRDHGRGMSPDEIRGLGGFIQHQRELHEQQGLGLGLAIARTLVSIYGGSMHIDSAPGKGTDVTVTLKAHSS